MFVFRRKMHFWDACLLSPGAHRAPQQAPHPRRSCARLEKEVSFLRRRRVLANLFLSSQPPACNSRHFSGDQPSISHRSSLSDGVLQAQASLAHCLLHVDSDAAMQLIPSLTSTAVIIGWDFCVLGATVRKAGLARAPLACGISKQKASIPGGGVSAGTPGCDTLYGSVLWQLPVSGLLRIFNMGRAV